MDNTLGIIFEIVLLVFNILIFMQLTVLKKDNVFTKVLMYAGSALVLGVYFTATYFFKMPEAVASFIFVTIPTALLFWILSKYKDTRFFTTFCFLDTVTYVIAFFSRATELVWGQSAGAIGYIVSIVLMATIYFKGRTYFKRYRILVDKVKDGWSAMAIATFLIYVMLIFITTNPVPLAQRVEYIPNFAIVSVTVLAFYGVFITSLVQKRKLSELNIQLMEEKKWHTIAYQDGLTKLDNRMSYMERINSIEREMTEDDILHAVIIDIDNFKRINDSLGHHFGDATLRKTADFIRKHFPMESYESFRIGGDEFAVIAKGVPSQEMVSHIEHLAEISKGEIGCSLSVGFAQVAFGQNRALETAFEVADQNMYLMKESKK